MDKTLEAILWRMMRTLFKAHPWHGVSIGEQAPAQVTAYIEIVPTDAIKYELDKTTGHLKVDRPQKYSNHCPTLYGLIPQTYCGKRVGAFCAERTGRKDIAGDGDPLDICVLTEKPIHHSDILVQAIPIGGLRMIDGNEADDKIIAVLRNDEVYGEWRDISECPKNLVERLRHYFLTYKEIPGATERRTEITHIYDAAEAQHIIQLSREDYLESYGEFETLLNRALAGGEAGAQAMRA
jgi:inorganic pyrophosphatase